MKKSRATTSPQLQWLVLLGSFLVYVQAHAVLQQPTPFNTNPSTTAPCGVGSVSESMKSTASASWVAGSTVTIEWHLIAGDGGGNLYGAFDPDGGTNFTVPAWTDTFPTKGAGVFYNKTFTVPETLTCANSPTKLCTLRVYTSSNWNSCTMVDIVAPDCSACPTPAPPQLQCTTLTTAVSFCPSTNVMIANGSSPQDINAELISSFNANRANPNVFSNGNSSACMSSYQTLLCSLSLPSCDPSSGKIEESSQACQAQCEQTMSDCGIVPAHVDLYPCSSYPLCVGEENGGGGGGGGLSPGGQAVLAIFIIAIVAAIASAGYVYYTKGQLLGYAYDKQTRKWGKVQSTSSSYNYAAYNDADQL